MKNHLQNLIRFLMLSASLYGCHPLPAPAVIVVTNDPATTLSVTWDPVEGATNFDIFLWLGLSPQPPTNAQTFTTQTNAINFSHIPLLTPYQLQVSADGATGNSGPSTNIGFIMPTKRPLLSVTNGVATVQSFVFSNATLQASADLTNWLAVQSLLSNKVNTYTCPATNGQQYFRIH